MPSLTLHPAAEYLDYVRNLLEQNGLPVEDLTTTTAEFYRLTADGDRVGVGGIETYGRVGLMRSVAVEDAEQRQGYGKRLCGRLGTAARQKGVETLYLLTTTAAEFFDRIGYTAVERSSVPDPIRETAEFESLCPSTATCMRKPLRGTTSR